MKLPALLILFFTFISYSSIAQSVKKLSSAEIYHAMEKLQFLGSALYVAAHPDDENTRLISYLANEVKANTAYLSLTRGGGGQNLIGTELADMLGVLRTQELLAARRIDGGQQMFSRAIDFGYSKHPDETLSIWNKDAVLSDVIWAIRKFKPDIIVNRFDHRSPGRTHGHHTSSAMLSVEAFDISNDPTKYSDQLDLVEPWQPKRVFFNTSWWFYGSREKFAEADKSTMMSVDIGQYYPILGKSNNEIAALSRSQHKCQGFGSTGTRGSELEYLELIKGDMPSDELNLFDGINTTWTRVKGGKKIGIRISQLIDNYNIAAPHESVEELLNIKEMITQIEDKHWKAIKLNEVDKIIQASMGLYLEAVADDNTAIPGEEIELTIEAVNRSGVTAEIRNIQLSTQGSIMDTVLNSKLLSNEGLKVFMDYQIPQDASTNSPYWLEDKGELGIYKVSKRKMIGNPESENATDVMFNMIINGHEIQIERPLVYKRNDPVHGEVYQPFNITAPVSTSLDDNVFIFSDDTAKEIKVNVTAYADNVEGSIELCHPNDWTVVPKSYDLSIENKGDSRSFNFSLKPPTGSSEDFIVPLVKMSEDGYTDNLVIVDYDHIPLQMVKKDASAKVVKLDIKKEGNNVAYIMGAGDKVPESLKQIGYEVDLIDISDIQEGSLSNYDAVIVGIRAYNTNSALKFKQAALLEFVKDGGNLIIQYNTSRRFNMDNIGPYPMKLSRDRVTDEFAEVRFNKPDHPVLNYPNKITSSDFDNWVQERGLYFPGEWDDKYDAIFSMNDKGESPKDGAMLVTKYGEGYYIYTGISFFRELPVGVPGAYRLLANMISLGKGGKHAN